MAGSDSSFTSVPTFYEDVFSQKEAARSAREDDLNSNPVRRQRTGWRRRIYERKSRGEGPWQFSQVIKKNDLLTNFITRKRKGSSKEDQIVYYYLFLLLELT